MRVEVRDDAKDRGRLPMRSQRDRISSMKCFPFHVPFVPPEEAGDAYAYEWGRFATKPGASGVLVRLESDSGLVGWGEASMVFHPYQPATILLETLRSMEPYVVGRSPFEPEQLTATLYTHAGWHFSRDFANYALGGLEMALYDLIGKHADLSLAQLLGGPVRDDVAFMYFLYQDALERTVAEAKRAVACGFGTLYLKVGVEDPHEEVERIRALREAVGDRVQIRVDANETWSPGVAVRRISQLEEFGLEFVEQPVLMLDIEGLAAVRSRVRTPIAADQAVRTPTQLLAAIRGDAADVVCSDPGSAGGIGAMRKHAAIAETAGLPMFMHSNVELGVGTAALIHLAASFVNCTYANQTEYQFLRQGDVLSAPLDLSSGRTGVPDGPGLGVAVDEDLVLRRAEEFERDCRREPGSVAGADWRSYLPSY